MSKVVLSGYPGGGLQFPEDGVHFESPKELSPVEVRAEERAFFTANYSLLWGARSTILSTPELYNARLSFSGLSCAYLGGGPISLGILLELWNNGNWTVACPECEGVCRIVFWGGSPLSGSNKWTGFCTICGKDRNGSVDSSDGILFVKEAVIARKLIFKNMKPVVGVKKPPEKSRQSSFLEFSRKYTEKYANKDIQESQEEQVIQEQPEEKKIIFPIDDRKTLREVVKFIRGHESTLD